MRILWILPLLVGCAAPQARTVGPDTYEVSTFAAPVRGGAAGARDDALVAANAKCDSLGKKITVTDTKTGWSFPVNGTATVTFTCK